jgi:replication factor A1
MEIKDLVANQGKVDLVLEVVEKEEPRTFEKFGKSGRVCKATVKDSSGEVKLTLWNDDVDKIKVGDKVHLQNGWCSEYQGEKQISAGKFGSLEVVESTESTESAAPEPTPPTEEPSVSEEEIVE